MAESKTQTSTKTSASDKEAIDALLANPNPEVDSLESILRNCQRRTKKKPGEFYMEPYRKASPFHQKSKKQQMLKILKSQLLSFLQQKNNGESPDLFESGLYKIKSSSPLQNQ